MTALGLALALAAPALAQGQAMQRIRLAFDDTSQIDGMVVGPGVTEVPTNMPGVTTAGGTLSWVKHRETTDSLGMRHVYYRQQYEHQPVARQLRVVGTAISLHYAPDGSLRWVNGAQLTDVNALPQVTLTNARQALDAVHAGLATRPGFTPDDPSNWSPGILARRLANAELMLAPLPDGSLRLQWQVETADVTQEALSAVIDAASGDLVAVRHAQDRACCFPPSPCTDCNAVITPDSTDVARSVPENEDLLPYCGQEGIGCGPDGTRNLGVYANDCPTCQYYEYNGQDANHCAGDPCTHEAAAGGVAGVPLIEVYYGVPDYGLYKHCRCDAPNTEDTTKYMRLSLKEVDGFPFYGDYGGKIATLGAYVPRDKVRHSAGDAMYYTIKTMQTLNDELGWCGIDGACAKPARVVVDGLGSGGAWFNSSDHEFLNPLESVRFDLPGAGERSMSAALDIVAHEWGHAVDYNRSAEASFNALCKADIGEACQMKEGFADVIAHAVEHIVQTNAADPQEPQYPQPEHHDWWAGEDWDTSAGYNRRADQLDSAHQCPTEVHYSVHVDDAACNPDPEDTTLSHLTGNRLAVVFRLMVEGGYSPAHGQISPCTGCHINVGDGMDLIDAARILFRVLTVQADSSTVAWTDLPQLTVDAAFDLFSEQEPDCAEEMQLIIKNSFMATGYDLPTGFHLYTCEPQSGS